MHPLDGPRLKIERAAEHLQTLNNMIRSWQNTKPFLCTGHTHPNQSSYVYTVETQGIYLDTGVVIGDILHNLHSALDNIVWQLALLTTPRPFDKTAFPIYLKNTPRAMKGINRVLQNVPNDAREVIEWLQPYVVPKPTAHALWALHELSDCDKHRTLTLIGERLRYDMRAGMTLHRINYYTDEVTVPMLDKNLPPLPPKISCDCLVIADKGGVKWRIDVVEAIHKFIRNTVFPEFVRFFP
jgi:hypothetical protein